MQTRVEWERRTWRGKGEGKREKGQLAGDKGIRLGERTLVCEAYPDVFVDGINHGQRTLGRL